MALLHVLAVLFVQDQPVENRQHLFAVGVNALEIFAKGGLEIVRAHPFVEQGAGDVNILPEGFDGMAAKEKPVEKSGLTLGGQGIEFVSYRHKSRCRKSQYSRAAGFGQAPHSGHSFPRIADSQPVARGERLT